MSSIMQQDKIPTESRSKMFLRSNSFQKLCSLAHPMRLKGFKSNKEALKSVFESLIVTTRGVIQSVTYRILCFLFLTPFTRLLSRPLSLVAGKDGKFSTVRLILKLTLSMIISTDKAKEECDNVVDLPEPEEEVPTQTKCVDTGVQTEVSEPEQFFDCRNEFMSKASVRELRNRLLEKSRPSVTQASGQRKRFPFSLMVYGSVLCCFVQLSALAYLLNVAAKVPPGLIFLILALGYIGYVMMRIFFDEYSSNRTDLSKPSAATTTTTTTTTTSTAMAVARRAPVPMAAPSKGTHPLLAAVGKQIASLLQNNKLVPINGSPRRSRSAASRNRVLLCADNKTISKMKIL